MMLHLSPNQKSVLDAFSRLRLFPVLFTDDWEEVRDAQGYRTSRKGLGNIKFDGYVFTADYHFTTHEPNEEAIAEVQALADKWITEGHPDWAENLLCHEMDDTGYTTPVTYYLTDKVEHINKIVVENPIFLAYRTWVGPIQEPYEKWRHDTNGQSLTKEMLTNMYHKTANRGQGI